MLFQVIVKGISIQGILEAKNWKMKTMDIPR